MPPKISFKDAYRQAPGMDSFPDDGSVERVLLNAYRRCWWNPETKAALLVLTDREGESSKNILGADSEEGTNDAFAVTNCGDQ